MEDLLDRPERGADALRTILDTVRSPSRGAAGARLHPAALFRRHAESAQSQGQAGGVKLLGVVVHSVSRGDPAPRPLAQDVRPPPAVSGDSREIHGAGETEPAATPPSRSWRVWRARAGVMLPVLVVLALLAVATLRHQQTQAIGAALARGETPPVPDLTLPAFDGPPLSLSGLRGHPVIVNFWASWCIPCRDEAPLLEGIWQEFQS